MIYDRGCAETSVTTAGCHRVLFSWSPVVWQSYHKLVSDVLAAPGDVI